MTNDDQQPELHETLQSRLSAAIPPAPPVTGWAERAAARARKSRARRRQALAVVGASCVATAIAVGAVSYDNGDSNGPSPGTDTEPEIADAAPQPPPGTRYMGINTVAVAVPQEWRLRVGGCYDMTRENAVVVAGEPWLSCATVEPRPNLSLLRIMPTDAGESEGLLEEAQPAGEINGISVLQTPTEPFADVVSSALIIPDANAIFWFEAPDAEVIEQVFNSLTLLPDDYVALPSMQAPWPCVRALLETAGVTVEIRVEDVPGLPNGAIVRSQPALGIVAERGSTVTLTVPAAEVVSYTCS